MSSPFVRRRDADKQSPTFLATDLLAQVFLDERNLEVSAEPQVEHLWLEGQATGIA
jgi:hypothetical protein